MAHRIEAKQVTVPAGTTLAGAVTTSLPFQDGQVTRLEVRVPPGPSGLVGFQVLHSGQRMIPFRDNVWIVADDEPLDWALDEYPTGGAWAVRCYNEDIYDHTLYLRFHVEEIGRAVAPGVLLVSIVEQSEAMDTGLANIGEPETEFAPEPTDTGDGSVTS